MDTTHATHELALVPQTHAGIGSPIRSACDLAAAFLQAGRSGTSMLRFPSR